LNEPTRIDPNDHDEQGKPEQEVHRLQHAYHLTCRTAIQIVDVKYDSLETLSLARSLRIFREPPQVLADQGNHSQVLAVIFGAVAVLHEAVKPTGTFAAQYR